MNKWYFIDQFSSNYINCFLVGQRNLLCLNYRKDVKCELINESNSFSIFLLTENYQLVFFYFNEKFVVKKNSSAGL